MPKTIGPRAKILECRAQNDCRVNAPEATSVRHQWPSIQLRLWIPLDCLIRRFSSIANSEYRWRENCIRIREKSVYTEKLSGAKVFPLQNLRRHDQTEMFLFRIRPLVCKRQNQSVTKTFRIHHESGTIFSSVNLV